MFYSLIYMFWYYFIVIGLFLVYITVSIIDIGNQFANVTDIDKSFFEIRRLPKLLTQTGSCYEMRKGKELISFCYPSIHVAGISKCGTSAMYNFLGNHDRIKLAYPSKKEYCPFSKTYYYYFKGFPSTPSINSTIYINGCINTTVVAELHDFLKPEAIYIMMVRSFPERLWATYNFWCHPEIDLECDASRWAKPNMYRSSELFHEILLSSEYKLSQLNTINWSCDWINNYYNIEIHTLYNVTKELPYIIASESLNSVNSRYYIKNLEFYINEKLNITINLSKKHLLYVNTGNNRGSNVVSNELTHGIYKISNYKPILNKTVHYIQKCWKNCKYISNLANYQYDCVD